MKKKRIALISVAAAVVVIFAAYMVFYAVPSEFGKRPFYDLTIEKVESIELNRGIAITDSWRADLTEAETEKLISIMRDIRIDGKTDMRGYELLVDGGSGCEYFSIKLKSGRYIRIGTTSNGSDKNYFTIDYVRYNILNTSMEVYNELNDFHQELLISKEANK